MYELTIDKFNRLESVIEQFWLTPRDKKLYEIIFYSDDFKNLYTDIMYNKEEYLTYGLKDMLYDCQLGKFMEPMPVAISNCDFFATQLIDKLRNDSLKELFRNYDNYHKGIFNGFRTFLIMELSNAFLNDLIGQKFLPALYFD